MEAVHKESANINPYRWLIFGVTSIGTFMATLDGSIVNVALPIISHKLNASLSVVQWVVTAYLLVITSLLPIFGKSGDILSRRLLYSAGFLIFGIGSTLCSLSSGIILLILSRILQAVGASILMANSPAIIASTFMGSNRGRALGITGTIVALGTMTGPTLGGILLDTLGWQSIFYINIPIALLGCILALRLIPENHQDACRKFDISGSVLLVIAIFGFLLALNQGHDWGWLSPPIIMTFIASVLSFSLFYRQEIKSNCPMIDLDLFKNRTFMAGNISGVFSFIAMFTNAILLPFYMHEIMRLTPTEIGILILPFPVTLAIVAPISGYMSERISQKFLTTTGLFITMLGLLYFMTLDVDSVKWQVALGQVIIGFGNGIFQSPNNNSVISSVPINRLGSASGLNALMRNLGMIMGIAISVSVFETVRGYYLSTYPSTGPANAFIIGYHFALFAGAVFAAAGTLVSSKRT